MEREHLEVLLGKIDRKLDIAIKKNSILNDKIDALAEKINERFDLIDLKFAAMF